MYDPTVGRFLSEDPLEFDASDPNAFRYVGNNPANKTDPSGLEEWPPPPDHPRRSGNRPKWSVVKTTPKDILAYLNMPYEYDRHRTWLESATLKGIQYSKRSGPLKIVIGTKDSPSDALKYAAFVHEMIGGPVGKRMTGYTELPESDPSMQNLAMYYEFGAAASIDPGVLTHRWITNAIRTRGLPKYAKYDWLQEVADFVSDCEKGRNEGKTFVSKPLVWRRIWFDKEEFYVSYTLQCKNRKISKATFVIRFSD